MTKLFPGVGKMGVVTALLAVALAAGGAWAQGKKLSPGSHIGVAKNLNDFEDARFTTIQDAVNAATQGQVIEILDTSTYAEQVTIDGRDVSPWDGKNGGTVKKVVGGKNGITLRYVPGTTSWNHPRPTIRYKDTENIHPKNRTEAQRESEIDGAGNFETNGALRVLRAKEVTIEGIAVDGGGAFAFGYPSVWGDSENDHALFHGNAAITLAVAGRVTIRDCDLKNAYFGINIKDRNTGGVFGNPNPADNDLTVPLSGFGTVGAHLFEYNKIHENSIGLFFESAWDLGSTVRYNLIYNNLRKATVIGGVSVTNNVKKQQHGAAFFFKDMYLSPIAIYNNTLYNNSSNIVGHWQSGGQHLIFNNIFSKVTPSPDADVDNSMFLDGKFPNRMHFNVFSVNPTRLQIQGGSQFDCPARQPVELLPGGYYVKEVQEQSNIFGSITGPTRNLVRCQDGGTQGDNVVQPGALITRTAGNGGVAIPAADSVCWLQTDGYTGRLPLLFKSVDENSANFLVPAWDSSLVVKYIKNRGWPTAGIRNSDGTRADLGAISSTGSRLTNVTRILPTNVVLISGTTAKSNFAVKNSGTITDIKIKMLRWVMPVPANTKNQKIDGYNGKDWPSEIEVVAAGSIKPVNVPGSLTVSAGNNTNKEFPISGTVGNYGFFEIIIEGKDANGNTVTSDVGFLPYRKLEYTFEITVLNDKGEATKTVIAGQKYSLQVKVKKSGVDFTETISEVAYDLLSDPTAFMYTDPKPENPLVYDKNVKFPKPYPAVYFTRADPNETISASGVYVSGANRLPILGTLDIVVRPGAPEKVAFQNPLPKSQGAPATINRGVPFEVRVEVQDRYGNAVDVATEVTVKSEAPNMGNVAEKGAASSTPASPAVLATSDKTTGVVTISAHVTNGNPKDEFDLTATLNSNNATDVGRLKIGRALDRLDIFYADTALVSGKVKYDPAAHIEGNVNDWFKVTVRAVVSDTINTTQTGKFIVVTPSDPGLIFSATSGGAPSTDLKFALTDGVATFWISASKDVQGACIDVESQNSDGSYGGVSGGNRCDITFTKPSSNILRAVVYGDAHGRPDSLLIYFDASAGGNGFNGMFKDQLPSKVELNWGGVKLTASGSAIGVNDDFVLRAGFTGATRPSGYTSIAGSGRGLAVVYGGIGGADAEDDMFDVLDGIGPVIASTADNIAARVNPTIVENPDPGKEPDVINITVSEQVRDINALVGGNSLFYVRGPDAPTNEPGASGGTALTVKEAVLLDGSMYQVVIEPITGGLQPGDWIRFNPAGSVVDRAGPPSGGMAADNKPSSDNRWAQLDLQEKTPEVREAWYTSNVTTGKPDTAFVVFDKPVNLETWFSDGSVNFGKQDVVNVATVGLSSLFAASGNTLKIDLTVAFKTSQSSVRTSDDMPFTLGYASAKKEEWGASVSVQARDKAKPVLADTVFLHIGDLRDDGTTTDTLKVTYSERPGDDALTLDRPIMIQTNGGACQPILKLFGQVVPAGGSSRFYKATYVVEGDLTQQCPAFPETGNMVKIDAASEFGDDRTPSNKLDPSTDADNLRQPLKVIRELKWTVKVKGNPFKSESAGSSKVGVEISPNAAGVKNVNIDATILVFDNVGALVVVDTLKNVPTKIDWSWNGTNKKGRLVGTGTYLFKAICRAKILNEGGGEEPMPPPPAVVRSLGVVRGN
jgi:hypothetical protein